MKYFDVYELIERDELKELQLNRLRKTVQRVYTNVKPYADKMDEAGVKPEDIRTLDDLRRLPFTVKQDLRDNYPYGLFACPTDEVVRVHASSGTTGKQTVVGYTRADLDIWNNITARAMCAAGATKGDFVHVSYGYGLFTGGLGLHGGAEKLGAATIPVSTGNTKRQLQIMRDFGSSVLCCTPSYALVLAEAIKDSGIDRSELKLKCGIFGAEPWSENMRRQIEQQLQIKAYDIYGLSEIMGPGVAYECSEQNGMHLNEDNFIVEVINPETGEPLPDGEYGELVITCITKQALPLIRYRTRDITALTHEPCGCGRTFVRMMRPRGRTDDMLIIRGVNVFPSQVEHVLLSMEGIVPQYMIVVDRIDNLDRMTVNVELSPDMPFDAIRLLEQKERSIKKALESTLGISAEVHLVEPKSIQRVEGKSVHVIDNRVLD